MKKKKTIGRVVLLCLSLCLTAGLLASCGSGNAVDSTWTSADYDAPTYFSRILPLGIAEEGAPTPREIFVAASRGYDMSADDFDDDDLVRDPDCVEYVDEDGNTQYVSLDGAKAALEFVKPKDDASIDKFESFCDELTAEQVIETVERMKTTVDLETSTNPLIWIGKFLQVLTNITFHNYVLALFVFAVIVEILLLYFGIRQQKNSIKQANLSPKERAIRKKYAGRNDQVSMRKMQEEIQRLYQEEGFNPMGGCLPLLIQLPIIIALYNIVIDPLRYVLGKAQGLSTALSTYATTARAAGGLGETLSTSGKGSIELLSKLNEGNLAGLKDFAYFSNADACANELSDVIGNLPNFNMFGLNTGLTPGFREPWALLIIPVLTFVAYFASMKINRKLSYQPAAQDPQMGCSNNVMDITMPLMSVYITFITPAAVGIYWIFKCIIGVVKQFVIHKLMPLPTFTEEDYKRAEKEMKGKHKPQKVTAGAVAPDGRVYRSLHHIDDEDDLPPRAPENREETKKIPSAPTESQEQGTMRAPLKEDRKNDRNKKKK